MNHGNVRNNALSLVSLQMTDKVPLDIIWEEWLLREQLLNPVFSKDPLSGLVSFPDGFCRMVLRNGNKSHPIRQFGPQFMDIIADFRHTLKLHNQNQNLNDMAKAC